MKWKYPSKDEYPINHDPIAESVPCLAEWHNEYMILYYNNVYDIWSKDDEGKYFCDRKEVTKWEYLDYIVSTISVNSYN